MRTVIYFWHFMSPSQAKFEGMPLKILLHTYLLPFSTLINGLERKLLLQGNESWSLDATYFQYFIISYCNVHLHSGDWTYQVSVESVHRWSPFTAVKSMKWITVNVSNAVKTSKVYMDVHESIHINIEMSLTQRNATFRHMPTKLILILKYPYVTNFKSWIKCI